MFIPKKAAVFAGALSVSAMLALSPAKAVTVTSSGITGGCANSIAGGVGQVDVLAGAAWNATFNHGDAAGGCKFSMNNSSSSAVAVTIAVATVNQYKKLWGFAKLSSGNGVELSTTGLPGATDWALTAGQAGARTFNFVVAKGASVTWDWVWGRAYAVGLTKPDIDFSVDATAVPVPAALPLLLTGLGGLGWLARRRKASHRA